MYLNSDLEQNTQSNEWVTNPLQDTHQWLTLSEHICLKWNWCSCFWTVGINYAIASQTPAGPRNHGYANYIRIHMVKVYLVKGKMSSDRRKKRQHKFSCPGLKSKVFECSNESRYIFVTSGQNYITKLLKIVFTKQKLYIYKFYIKNVCSESFRPKM